MSIRNLRPSLFDEVLLDFAAAEMLTTHELGRGYLERFGKDRLEKLRALSTSQWSADDRDAARAVASSTRGQYLTNLGSLGLDWYEAKLDTASLGDIRVIDIDEFTNIAPSRLLSDLTVELDKGRRTRDDRFTAKYRAMRPAFESGQMKGRPMLVAEREEGPFTEFEGLCRLCCLQSQLISGTSVPLVIEVFLGVGEGVRR